MEKFKEILHDITDKTAKFFATVVKKLQKMDKRMLIMIAAAVLLVIIIFALIIGGINSNKNKEPISVPEITTDDSNIQDLIHQPNAQQQSDKYTVDTGETPKLNLRSRPSINSSVLTTIPNGTQVEVHFVYENNGTRWGVIDYNGEIGFASMEYLKK